MYNVDDIFARLMKGEKLEDIGNELANAMNEAQEKYAAAQKAEEEKLAAETKKAQRAVTRRELLWEVLKAIRNYAIYTDYAAVIDKWMAEATDEDVAELDAQLIELFKTFELLAQLNFSFDNIKHVVEPKKENIQKDVKKVSAADPNKALADFLQMMGW